MYKLTHKIKFHLTFITLTVHVQLKEYFIQCDIVLYFLNVTNVSVSVVSSLEHFFVQSFCCHL